MLCRQYTLQVSRTKHTPRECTRAHVRVGYDLRAFDFASLVPEDGPGYKMDGHGDWVKISL